MDTKEAAKDLEVSPSFLTKDRAKGGRRQVPFRRAGRKVIYDPEHLEAYKAACRVGPDTSKTKAA
jgi:hypothetical protein